MFINKQKFKKTIKFFLQKIGLYKKTSVWPLISDNRIKYFVNNVRTKTSIETLNDIKEAIINKEKGAYLRFGDGDVFLMMGLNDMLHMSNKNIAFEMKEAFKLNVGKMHKALTINSNIFGFEKGMMPGMHFVSDNEALRYLSVTYKFIDIKLIYSPVALHHLAVNNTKYCIDFLLFLKKTHPIFVGNHDVKKVIIEKLFGNLHIKTPSDNSYTEIDRIERELVEVLEQCNGIFRVVVVAMGCPGRILQKRILKKGFNVYLFDFGSLLDAFNGENSRLWIEMAGLDYLEDILNRLDA